MRWMRALAAPAVSMPTNVRRFIWYLVLTVVGGSRIGFRFLQLRTDSTAVTSIYGFPFTTWRVGVETSRGSVKLHALFLDQGKFSEKASKMANIGQADMTALWPIASFAAVSQKRSISERSGR